MKYSSMMHEGARSRSQKTGTAGSALSWMMARKYVKGEAPSAGSLLRQLLDLFHLEILQYITGPQP